MATPYPGEHYSPFTLEMLQQYPKLLRMQEPPQEPTPYSQRGLENPKGWEGLCRRLFQEMDELNRPYENTPDSIQLAQLKSKFGGLRVYIEHAPKDPALQDRLRNLITKYEQEAAKTCESTGEPGQLYVSPDGWYMSLSSAEVAKRGDLFPVPDTCAALTTVKPQDITNKVVDLIQGG